MGKRLKVRLTSRGARELLTKHARPDIERRVNAVQDGCGEGYVGDVQEGANRVHGMIRTATPDAIRDNLRNNTLLKNVDRGR